MSNMSSNSSCSPILGSSDSKDGGLPLVLGINVAFATVSDREFLLCNITCALFIIQFVLIVFGCMHVFLKDFVMAAVKNKR